MICTQKAAMMSTKAMRRSLRRGNMTTAVNMFLRTAIREHGIPFELKLEVPNNTTTAAIEEGRKMLSDPSAPRYSNMDALKAALEV